MSTKPVALVTGGSRGIGRGICLELGKLGYAVTVNYATRSDAAEEVVKLIESEGGTAIAIGGSVAVAEDRERLLGTTLDTFGQIDVLVNNAGITSQGRKDLLEATEDSWDTVFATNLKGPFFLAQAVANAMVRLLEEKKISSAKIINISSISAHTVSVNRADYCMTKAAIGMMTQLYAQRLAEYGIGVFEISPGVITSDMTAAVKEKYDRLIAEGLWPIQRWGQPEDIAKAVSAIVQDYFPFTTGQCFDVDGGFRIRTL